MSCKETLKRCRLLKNIEKNVCDSTLHKTPEGENIIGWNKVQ